MYMKIYSNGIVNIGNNQGNNKQLVLYDSSSGDSPSTATDFHGFGIGNHIMRYHKFYGGSTNYATIDSTGVNIDNDVLTSNNVASPASIKRTLRTNY